MYILPKKRDNKLKFLSHLEQLLHVTLGYKKGHIKHSMVMLFNNPVAKDSLFERFSELQQGYKPRQPC